MRLYEIANEYQRFLFEVEQGNIPEEAIADTLEGIEGELTVKVDNIACLIKNTNAEVKALADEERALRERRRAKSNMVDRLKNYLVDALTDADIKKVEGTRAVVSIRNSKSVEIDEDAELADEYLRIKTEPNKTAIKDALQGGVKVDGARIVTSQGAVIK